MAFRTAQPLGHWALESRSPLSASARKLEERVGWRWALPPLHCTSSPLHLVGTAAGMQPSHSAQGHLFLRRLWCSDMPLPRVVTVLCSHIPGSQGSHSAPAAHPISDVPSAQRFFTLGKNSLLLLTGPHSTNSFPLEVTEPANQRWPMAILSSFWS